MWGNGNGRNGVGNVWEAGKEGEGSESPMVVGSGRNSKK